MICERLKAKYFHRVAEAEFLGGGKGGTLHNIHLKGCLKALSVIRQFRATSQQLRVERKVARRSTMPVL